MLREIIEKKDSDIEKELAFDQFDEETGLGKKEFEKNVKKYGWEYVVYYYKRYREVNNG